MSRRELFFFLFLSGIGLSLVSCTGGEQQTNSQPLFALVTATRNILNQQKIVSPALAATQKATDFPAPTATSKENNQLQVTVTAYPLVQTEIAGTMPEPTCLEKGGRISTGTMRSKRLKLPLDYRVYLPPCYEENPEMRYPVLYLFHGQSFNDDQWDRMGVDETANRLIASKQLSPFLIVMPRDRYGGQPSETSFSEVIIEELLPMIDRKYRTIPERNYRAIGGLSRGAGWSVHFALKYWTLFGTLGAHSPAIFYEDAQQMRPILDAIPKEALPRIFIDVGDKDRPEIMDVAVWFEQLLNERDIPHEWHMFSGFHDEAYWKSHIKQYLLWYASNW